MKFLIVALAFVSVCSAASIFNPELDNFWEEFKSLHNKQYLNNEEETLRLVKWKKTLFRKCFQELNFRLF